MAPLSRGVMSVFCNVIKPQGLEPFQFSTKISSPSAANLSFEFEGVMRKQSTRKVCCKTVTVRLTGQQAEPVRATRRVLLEALSIHVFESLLS